MKVLYCQDCGDIIAPWPVANKPRDCRCGRHAVWWTDPSRGYLRAHDRYGLENGWPKEAAAFILGITNLLLHAPGNMSAEMVEGIIDAHEDTYLFKQWRSPIIRIRPGESGDTRWAQLPEEEIKAARSG